MVGRYTRLGLSTSESPKETFKSRSELIMLIENGLDDEADINELR